MPDYEGYFTKQNLDKCLRELAKEYRRVGGKAIPAEVILVGGAAILTNYGFRYMTNDVDACIQASSAMKEAINIVGDRLGLPNGWINSDFQRTSSYSPSLSAFSKYYKTFSGILEVRTVSAEYLVAMKLHSGRKYKHDLSDVVGILAEHEKKGQPITMEAVEKAVHDLYGGWSGFPTHSREFIQAAFQQTSFEALFEQIRLEEQQAQNTLLAVEENHPGTVTQDNTNEILQSLGME